MSCINLLSLPDELLLHILSHCTTSTQSVFALLNQHCHQLIRDNPNAVIYYTNELIRYLVETYIDSRRNSKSDRSGAGRRGGGAVLPCCQVFDLASATISSSLTPILSALTLNGRSCQLHRRIPLDGVNSHLSSEDLSCITLTLLDVHNLQHIDDMTLHTVTRLNGLQSIILSSLPLITDRGLAHLALCTTLTSLDVSYNNQLSGEYFSQLPISLISLDVNHCTHINAINIAVLLKRLNNNITTLNISHSHPNSIQNLLYNIKQNVTNLTDLDISYNNHNHTALTLDINNNVEDDNNNNNYNATSTNSLAPCLSHLSYFPNLKRFHLNGVNKITDACVSVICYNCVALTDFSLVGCSLLESVIVYISTLSHLLSLDLAKCTNICADSFASLYQNNDDRHHQRHMQQQSLSSSSASLSHVNMTLTSLSLASVACEWSALFSAVGHMRFLRHLDISGLKSTAVRTSADDQVMYQLAPLPLAMITSLQANLQTLDVSGNDGLTDESLMQMVNAQTNNGIINGGSASAVVSWPSLRRLRLLYCVNITDDGLMRLCTGLDLALSKAPLLIDLIECESVTARWIDQWNNADDDGAHNRRIRLLR